MNAHRTPAGHGGILCVGQIVADVVVRPVDRLPHPGRLEVLEDFDLVPGGCACNTACVLAKLGARASVLGLIGNDTLGEAILGPVGDTGVNVELVRKSSGTRTAAVVVMVAGNGERSFLYRRGGNELFSTEMVPDEALAANEIVHVGGAMKLAGLDFAGLLGRAKRSGCLTTLDTDWDPGGRWMGLVGPAMPFIDHFITNEEEGSRLTGKEGAEEIARALLALGPPDVIVKMGERGSLHASRAGLFRFPGFPVKVVDTTCAGDAFVAGYLLGIIQGLGTGERMALGNAAGALCTTAVSHRGVESLGQAVALIRSHPDLYPKIEGL
jgi:sugar/nucleoside kinase (ribokinase family)